MQNSVKPILKKPPGYKDPSVPAKPPPHQKKKSRRICCCVCISLLVLLILLAVTGGIFYLWFTPKLPVFRLKPVKLSRFSVTLEPDGTAYIDTRANVWVEVKNSNPKLTFYYGGLQLALTADEDTELGSASEAGYTQGNQNTTVLRFVTHTDGNQLVDLETGKRLNATVRNEAVKLNIEIKTKVGVGIGVGKFKIGMLPLDVACGGVSLKKLKAGAGPPTCKLHWFSW